jgi:hypothetical protein
VTTRAERLRAYWEEVIPQGETIFLSDVDRILRRLGDGKPIISRRTLQRRAATGKLPAMGGETSASSAYKVFRTDLITFLVSLDTVAGVPPPTAPPPYRPEPRRQKRKKRRKGKAQRQTKRPAAPPPANPQGTLFD